MSAKIVQAANAMLSNPNAISEVMPAAEGDRDEFFFLYAGKYKWSIMKLKGEYVLYLYPGKQPLEDLASIQDEEWQMFNEYVAYNTKEIATKEAHDTFSELYNLVKERRFNVNVVLDDIIKDG